MYSNAAFFSLCLFCFLCPAPKLRRCVCVCGGGGEKTQERRDVKRKSSVVDIYVKLM
jgi:hypothetical protein